MLTPRIENALQYYKRDVSNTQQFTKDLSSLDKLTEMIHKKKDFFRVRNRFLDCLDTFQLEMIDSFVKEYYFSLFDEESIELYYKAYKEISMIDLKRKQREA